MSWYWFPDNTVLCNFASVSRLDLLRDVLRERGRWVEAIAAEATMSARYYPSLANIATDGWLRDPIEVVDPQEIQQVERIRRAVFGGAAAEPTRHLGEAQTCQVILNWNEFSGSYWITDDRDAQEYAKGQGIVTRDTMDLISEAIVEGHCTRDEGFRLLYGMKQNGRYLRVPIHPSHL